MGEKRGTYRVLVGKIQGKNLLLTRSLRREDDIKIDFEEKNLRTGLT